MGQRSKRAQQKQLGGCHAHQRAPGIAAARDAALPPLRPACRRLRRLQNAAPASGRASRHQAARAGRQPLAPGQMQGRHRAASHSWPGVGLPLARAPVGAPCAQKGRSAHRFSRAQKPLHRRYAQLRHLAARSQPAAFALARAHRQLASARHLPANRAGLRRPHHCAGAAAPGAAGAKRYRQAARFCCAAPARAVVVAAQGA